MFTQAAGIIISNTSSVISTYGKSPKESMLEMERVIRKHKTPCIQMSFQLNRILTACG